MRFLRIIYCLYALAAFVLCMLLVIPPVVAASFFGKVRGGNFIYRLCSYWARTWFFLIGIRHQNFYEHPHDKNKQYIFVANHISYLDAPVIVRALHQKVRVLGKAEISKVPLFGFIYRNAVVTVNRSSATHRANSVRILKSVIKKGIHRNTNPHKTIAVFRYLAPDALCYRFQFNPRPLQHCIFRRNTRSRPHQQRRWAAETTGNASNGTKVKGI
jgi:1-acyl-sn-glycerol-3-phosphate acyltransferase